MEKAFGLVLKSIKYGDTSLIAYIYTREFGMLSLLFKGFFSSKNKSLRLLTYPLVPVEFSFKPNKKSSLILPRQPQAYLSWNETLENPVKLMMLQFLAEILHNVLREDDINPKLFDFIYNQLNIFNEKKHHFAEFHLILLMKLTQFMGFSPMKNSDGKFFRLTEGDFTHHQNSDFSLNEIETQNWKKLLDCSFSPDYQNQFNRTHREQLLHSLILYFQIHISSFKEPDALTIIKEILE
ncbi:MAG: recombination protein O N-terminal domain-containing protein [Flavobacteriaceae bacterium]|nr:recombination protein O N-terminal domain-containing protein [Flavobacteriaceae bacterium]